MPLAVANVNGTMRAVVWGGTAYNVEVVDWPKPVIINATDAIVKLHRAGICGSDLHVYRGTNPGGSQPPFILGHEGVGYVSEVGPGVTSLKAGDAVVIPFTTHEGHLHTDLTRHIYSGYGFGLGLGAEYVRVPFADDGLIPIRFSTNDTLINDYLCILSDIFATGWTALDYAGFEAGDTVAVFGEGPVGLLAAYSAILRGASRVYSIDYVADRLQLTESIGSTPINFRDVDPVQQILALEPGGVACSVNAVGYEQVNRNLTVQSDVIIQNMLAITSRGGGMGTVGVYVSEESNSPGAPRGSTVHTHANISLAQFQASEYSWGAGFSDPIRLAPQLLHLVTSGRAKPGFIVGDVVSIEDAPDEYARFERHEISKVLLRFD